MAPFSPGALQGFARDAIFRKNRSPWGGGAGEDTKGPDMKHLLERLRSRRAMAARFRQTRDEIARMPLDVALDLDIHPGDADRIAWNAVYGHNG